ncbi:hypothetical protein ACNPON_17565 [Glutamicibacter sp. AGC13]
MGANDKHEATYHGAEYTPDTTRVRHGYVDHVDYSAQLHGLPSNDKGAGEAFDRWLETVRAEAKAEALEEAASAYPVMLRDMVSRGSVAAWLRARADQHKEHQVHEASQMLQKLVEMVQANKDYIVPTRAQVEALYQEAANQGHGLMIVEGKPGTLRIAPGAVPGELIVVNPEALA